MKRLVCIAPDGAFVTEGRFETVEDAWNRSCDMGSRWFFYPIHVVTGEKLGKILDVPDEMGKGWIGKNLSTLRKAIADNSEEICAWVNGDALCPCYHPF
jgi:hypothetical protein